MNQQISTKQTGGFTLIELMLSMTFVSVLLLTIALTVIQIATIYNRGMTLKEVNQSARDISDDMRRSFASSQVFIVNTNGTDSSDYVTVMSTSGTAIAGGRLCTGTVSYVWNIARAMELSDSKLTHKLAPGGAVGDPIRFVKIPDTNKKYCSKNPTTLALENPNIVDPDVQLMTNLLDAGDHKLALQALKVVTTNQAYDVSTGQRLYTVIYTIGSGDTSAMNLAATPIRCLDPGQPNANTTYCNVQQFTIVLRVGNTVN